MVAVANNIINEFLQQNQKVFTIDEIIGIINGISGINKLPVVENHDIRLDTETYLTTYNGNNHTLPRKEFELLYYLIENKNKVMRRSTILRNVWGDDIIVGERTIDVHIRKLRKRLPNISIDTVKGIGYLWKE